MVELMATLAQTLGDLKASGWQSSPVKEEIRRNAVARIAAGEALFEGVLGYEHTVMPQLENALLAGHDMIFLGERGQAKTRIIRVAHRAARRVDADRRRQRDQRRSVRTRSASTRRDLIAEMGDATPIDWVHRDDRYGEKLATPDTSIADLIGEVDPIKVAEGRYLSDELTHALRPGAAHQPRHLRHQRAPRPRRAHPGRPAQRPGRARRADPRLQDPPAARRVCWSPAPTPRTTPTAAASSRR